MNLQDTFDTRTPLVGMVHLPALPGAPEFDGDRQQTRERALADARTLAESGGSFLRVNVHTGSASTDQGHIEGRAHETLRLRERIDADVAVLADIAVKHAAPPDRDIEALAADAIERGLADGLVVSGPTTGETVETSHLDAVLAARDAASRDVPVFLGSGVTAENAADLLARADGAIVGTALKRDGVTTNPVDRERAEKVVAAVEQD